MGRRTEIRTEANLRSSVTVYKKRNGPVSKVRSTRASYASNPSPSHI